MGVFNLKAFRSPFAPSEPPIEPDGVGYNPVLWGAAHQEIQSTEERRWTRHIHGDLVKCLNSKQNPYQCFSAAIEALDNAGVFISASDSYKKQIGYSPFPPQSDIAEELRWILLHPKAQEVFVDREEAQYQKCLVDRISPEETVQCHDILKHRLQMLFSIQKAACMGDSSTEQTTLKELEYRIRSRFPFLKFS